MYRDYLPGEENRGCTLGCFCLLAVIAIVCIVSAILGFVIFALKVLAFVGLGGALWLLTRYVWREVVNMAPNNAFVQYWMHQTPTTRYICGGLFCLFVMLLLTGVWGSAAV